MLFYFVISLKIHGQFVYVSALPINDIVDSVYISPPNCILSVNGQNYNSCTGNCNAAIKVNSNSLSSLSYNWILSSYDSVNCSPVLVGDSAYHLSSGNYICIVTDSSGCADTLISTLISDSGHFSSINIFPQTCSDVCNGEIIVDVDSAYMPISYIWNTGDTINNLYNKCAGFYSCYINSYLGCTDTVGGYINLSVPSFAYNNLVLPLCPQVKDGLWTARTSLSDPPPYILAERCALDTGYFEFVYPLASNCNFIEPVMVYGYLFPDLDSVCSFTIDTPDCGYNNGQINFNINSINEPFLDRLFIHNVYDSIDYVTSIGLNTNYYVYNSISYSSFCNYSDTVIQIDTVYISKQGCSAIFPGDANNDGIANNVDLLNIGLAYGDTGFVRADTTITWDGKYAQDWQNVFTDSLNHKFADCNGDGVVNDDDTTANSLNYGFVHNRGTDVINTTANTYIEFNLADTIKGRLFEEAEFNFQNTSGISDSIVGIAFSIIYDPLVIDPGSIYFEHDSGMFDEGLSNVLNIRKNDEMSGRLDIAFCFKDHLNRKAIGYFGKLIFQLRSDYLVNPLATFIEISDIHAVNAVEQPIPIGGFTDSIFAVMCDPSLFSAEVHLSNYPYCSGSQWNCTGQARVTVFDGMPPYTYSWAGSSFLNSAVYTNDTVYDLCALNGGYFICTVTDSHGCSTYGEKDLMNLNSGCNAGLFNSSVDSISCLGNNDGQICVWWPIGMQCDWYHRWSDGDSSFCKSGLSAGSYTCVILDPDDSSCNVDTVFWETFVLSNPNTDFPVVFNQPQCGQCNGSVMFNSNSQSQIIEVTYDNNPLPGFMLSGMCADSVYRFTIYFESSTGGCYHDTLIVLSCIPDTVVPLCSLDLNAQMVNECNGLCTGNIALSIINETGNVSYDWSQSIYDTSMCHILNNSLFQDSISTGYYKLIVTDSLGCRDSIETTINSGNVVVNLISEESCYNFCGGSINASASGGIQPYHYNWGEITLFLGDCTVPVFNDDSIANNLHSGFYYCIVTDSMGCSDSAIINVNTANMDGIMTYSYPQTCANDCNGGMELWHFVMNVSTPSILWSNGSSNFSTYGVCEGTYTYTLTWGLTCVDTGSVIITGADSVYLGYVTMNPTCDSCNGAVSLNVLGGVPPYEIYFDQQFYINNNDTVFNVCATEYIIYIEDSLNCKYIYDVILNCDSLATDIGNNSKDQFILFPNPNNGKFKVSGLNYASNEIEIINVIGEVIFALKEIKTSEIEIKAELKPGVYLCRIKSDDQSVQVKFVVH